MNQASFDKISALRAGFSGCCPRCGRGRLFSGFLDLAEGCSHCGLSYGFADSGDGAAWFVMLIAGVAAVGGALFAELQWQPSYWVHGFIALVLGLVLPLAMLRPAKGILICQQYAMKAQEGRLR